MGLFGRKQEAQRDAAPGPDAVLPLDEVQGQQMRSLVQAAFAQHGVEVLVGPDRVVGPQSRIFGLLPVVADALLAPADDWAELIGKQVAQALEPSPTLDDVGDVELDAHTVARLISEPLVPDRSWFPTSDRMADDLLLVPTLDLGDEVLIVAESAFAERDDIDATHTRGLVNLHRLVGEAHLEAHRLKGQHIEVDIVRGDSPFTASFAVFLPELLDRFGLAEGVRGVLVSVPSRHQLAFRVVDGDRATVRGVEDMFAFGILGHRDGTDPISPHVYWVRDGNWTRITDFEAGQPVVRIEGEAADALGVPKR